MKTEIFCEPIDIENLSTEQMKAIATALRSETKKVITDAKSNLQSAGAVKTGSLLKAIKSKVKRKKDRVYAVIGIDNNYTSVDENGHTIRPSKYAPLVEQGTKHNNPTFFFTKAVEANRQAILDALSQAAEEASL